jgi:hypothetical protein
MLRAASWPKEGSDPCQQGYLHVILKPMTAHDLLVIEYIKPKILVMKKALLLTSFKEIEQFNRNFHCIGTEAIGDGGRTCFRIRRVEARRWQKR